MKVPPNVSVGLGANISCYQLLDGSYVYPNTLDLGWSGKIYGITIKDTIGREFEFVNFED